MQAKTHSARVWQQLQESHGLDQLSSQIRALDGETLVSGTSAAHAMSEVYSPPRIVKFARQLGHHGGYSLYLTAPSPDGRKCDVSKPSDRLRCWRLLSRDNHLLLICLSSMHTRQYAWEPAQPKTS